jgi:hypothetical protein
MFFNAGGDHFSFAIHNQRARSAGPNVYSEELDVTLRIPDLEDSVPIASILSQDRLHSTCFSEIAPSFWRRKRRIPTIPLKLTPRFDSGIISGPIHRFTIGVPQS